ncbi:hypothetical protein [Winogradskya humida]|uniref:Uncharacterized protein n=1 Tax=Winogradskya humida TaxID=113566 RepID=A0ABQ3ZMQ0_9ACTN|nr:hypothetical protein [Actinoplanes humidus]GIE19861.1 hypothetical protein Ahu01nite_029630 [Actinoplanes humidus]
MDPRRHHSWLHPHLGTTTLHSPAPEAYLAALSHVARTLDKDPAWRRWWQASGIPHCELGIVAANPLDHPRPSADIRKIKSKLRANFTCAAPASTARPAALLPLAIHEVTGMFEVIREAIALPPLPPVPPLPALPDHMTDLEVTHRTLPPDQGPLEPQGYLTLTQIQEFFTDDPTR